MGELLPICAGLLLGGALAAIPSRSRLHAWTRPLWIRACLVAIVGTAATVLNGEYAVTWAFALVDIGQVGLLAWIGWFATGRLLRHFVSPPAARRAG